MWRTEQDSRAVFTKIPTSDLDDQSLKMNITRSVMLQAHNSDSYFLLTSEADEAEWLL